MMIEDAQPPATPKYLICSKCGKRKPVAFFVKATFYQICRACLKRITGK